MNPEDVAAMHDGLQRPTLAILDGADAIDYTPDDSDDTLGHDDTIATVAFGPRVYEIAWLWDPDLEPGMRRDPWTGVVRLHGDDLVNLYPSTLGCGYATAAEVASQGLGELAELLEFEA